MFLRTFFTIGQESCPTKSEINRQTCLMYAEAKEEHFFKHVIIKQKLAENKAGRALCSNESPRLLFVLDSSSELRLNKPKRGINREMETKAERDSLR